MSIVKSTMPNGAVVYYRDSDHSYWKSWDALKDTCSGRVAGASAVSKCIGNGNVDGLLHWAVRLAKEGKDWKEEQKAKGELGHGAHNVLEQLARGNAVKVQTLQERAVFDWWANPQTLDQERIVYSPTYGVAGRFDWLGVLDPPKTTLLDLKTSTYVKPEHVIQLNLYELARREVGYDPADELVILHIKDGKAYEIPVPIKPEWAVAALAIYQTGKMIRSQLTKAEKTARVEAT